MRCFQSLFRPFVALLSAVAVMPIAAHADPIPTAYYTHEDSSDRLKDDASNTYHLTNAGAVTFIDAPAQAGFPWFDLGETVGKYSGASTSYLSLPDLVYEDGSFTFTALVNVEGTSWRTILGSDNFRFQRIEYYSSPDTKYHETLHFRGPGSDLSSAPETFLRDQWYFVALRYDRGANNVKGFLQGASETWNPVTITSSVAANFNELSSLTLGRSGILATNMLNGMIDNARFYNAALTDAQIGDVFSQYVIPEPSSAFLLLAGLCGLMLRRSRRRN